MSAAPHSATTFADLARRWRPGDFIADQMDQAQTPALVINREAVDANIAAMCGLLGERWRPHVKTAKLEWTMRRLVAAGVTHCKCATPLELEVALRAGFEDVVVDRAGGGDEPVVGRVDDHSFAVFGQLVADDPVAGSGVGHRGARPRARGPRGRPGAPAGL